MLQQKKELKRRQHQQGQTRRIPPPDTAALRLETLPLFHAEIFKTDTDPIEVEYVSVVYFRSVVVDKDIVDPDTAAGEHIINTPLAQIITPENRVAACNLTLRNVNIGVRGTADDDLPVLNGEAVAAVPEVGPGLGVVFFAEHGTQAAHQNRERKQNQNRLAGRQCIGIKSSLHANTSPLSEMAGKRTNYIELYQIHRCLTTAPDLNNYEA